MLCTTATNTSNTIRTQTGAAVSLIQRSGYVGVGRCELSVKDALQIFCACYFAFLPNKLPGDCESTAIGRVRQSVCFHSIFLNQLTFDLHLFHAYKSRPFSRRQLKVKVKGQGQGQG